MNHPTLRQDSNAWISFVWLAFGAALCMGGFGIYLAPVDGWVRGYLAMAFIFTIGTSITLAKTLRDKSESDKMVNRVADARTEQLLGEFELRRNG